MNEFARRPAADRADLFRTVAAQRGFNPAIVEKDFWVCWTLKHLFALETPPAGLLFKGGTSLSKVFKVIERFSEDIDLSFDRSGLGFGGDKDPFSATGRKQRERSLKALADTCRNVIQARFLPQLTPRCSGHPLPLSVFCLPSEHSGRKQQPSMLGITHPQEKLLGIGSHDISMTSFACTRTSSAERQSGTLASCGE